MYNGAGSGANVWTRYLGAPILYPPTMVYDDSTFYVAIGGVGSGKGNLLRVRLADGAAVWNATLPGEPVGSPMALQAGRLIVATSNGTRLGQGVLSAVDTNGATVWATRLLAGLPLV
jgi:outer membrane protein assembly factor BamB